MKAVIKELAISAEMYQKTISEMLMGAYLQELGKFNSEGICEAIRTCRRELKSFPTIADILERTPGGGNTDDQECLIAANLILSARSKCGYTNPDRARAMIGELGWEAVKRFGGWVYICEQPGNQDGMLRAQLRETLKAIKKLHDHGKLDTPPSLEKSLRQELEQKLPEKIDYTKYLKKIP